MKETFMISPLDINLDVKNPRVYIPDDASQDGIRLYLLEHEDVIGLAKGILRFGGLIPGERIIISKEQDKFFALEGNRRICACQLFLNPDLIPQRYKNQFPLITSELKLNIESVEVDLVSDRKSNLKVLSIRHIDGARPWKTIPKQKFFAELFEEGNSLEEIEVITHEKPAKIKTMLQSYYLIKYALDLPIWSKEQKEILYDLPKLKPTRYLRIFSDNDAGRKILKLFFDEKTFKPKSELPKDVFDKAIELIATAAFITKTIDTRSNLIDVPGIHSVISKSEVSSSLDNPIESDINPDDEYQEPNKKNIEDDLEPSEQERSKGSNPNKKTNEEDSKTDTPKPKTPIFFENIKCSISSIDSDGIGIIGLINEIRDISTPYYLNKFAIASAMLLRSLIEQSLKYHLKKINEYDTIKSKGSKIDPTLQQVINYTKNNLKNVFPDKAYQRTFNSIFDNQGIKDYLDLIVHHTNLAQINRQVLESLAKSGLRSLIEYIINNKYNI